MNLSWSSFYNFTGDNVGKFATEDAGVYILWLKLKNEKWMCYYVGQADSLKQRLSSHLLNSEPNKCIKDHIDNHINGFEYAKVGRKTDRDGIEKFLYDHYKPECNQQDPGGQPISVNFP